MSNILSLTQDAQRRNQRSDIIYRKAAGCEQEKLQIEDCDRELLLLLAVVLLLLRSGANIILLLAIVYVII